MHQCRGVQYRPDVTAKIRNVKSSDGDSTEVGTSRVWHGYVNTGDPSAAMLDKYYGIGSIMVPGALNTLP